MAHSGNVQCVHDSIRPYQCFLTRCPRLTNRHLSVVSLERSPLKIHVSGSATHMTFGVSNGYEAAMPGPPRQATISSALRQRGKANSRTITFRQTQLRGPPLSVSRCVMCQSHATGGSRRASEGHSERTVGTTMAPRDGLAVGVHGPERSIGASQQATRAAGSRPSTKSTDIVSNRGFPDAPRTCDRAHDANFSFCKALSAVSTNSAGWKARPPTLHGWLSD